MKTHRFFIFMILLTSTAHAVEPWADKSLPVKEGLALWLDAGTNGPKLAMDKLPSGVWFDASGNKRDARQEVAEAQPQSRTEWPSKMFSFDGKSQYFVVKSAGLSMREATVVVFARAKWNDGGFRGLISASRSGANDYLSGFNVDLGGKAMGDEMGSLNVEGAGFSGEGNLLADPLPIGAPFGAVVLISADKVTASLGQSRQAERPRAKDATMRADEIVIGARSFDNAGGVPSARGFFQGDIFEVMVYDRALTAGEVGALRNYFASKYAGVVFIAPTKVAKVEGSVPLVAEKNPPVIQPLVPGFVPRRLPLSLRNINFLRYRADGRLFAGGYDGTIHVLRDTDGDGLEDKAEIFYQSSDLTAVMGMALTLPGYSRGEGVFVATRGRILLILDKDKDGKGDEVVTVTKDWEKARVLGGGVSDSLGVAVGPDGSVYFTLATHDFTNAYLLDAATGKAGYNLATERGTVRRVSPDFKTVETVSTGMRVNFGLAFNAAGDLFATEQEGATWLANGNPYDELLHIELGRHYGFPAKHPQHLPDVVDEPSTFDYGPQHQSAVGLAFNEPVAADGPHFGPAAWRGDALVATMSRGKIYRTKLVKTGAGYVAKNETFAQLQRIVIDQAISPDGSLAVALHGGSPDWGSGPTGAGELWKIVPEKSLPPQPVLAWSASPVELRVSFDRTISSEALSAMQGKVSLVQSRYAQAGERFETMRPGYQVVKNQLSAPRYPVPVQKLSLADEGRTLVITTPERSAAVGYAISIAADVFQTNTGGNHGGQIDLLADLTGLEAGFVPTTGEGVKTWLPHPDFGVSRKLTEAGGAQHGFFDRLQGEGAITLSGQLDLGRMLYPAIQEGSKLDWEYPAEQVTVVFGAARPFTFTLDGTKIESSPDGARHEARRTLTTFNGKWAALEVSFPIGTGNPELTTYWFTDRSAIPRAFPLRRVLLPYAKMQEAPPMPHNEDLPELAGASRENGKAVFLNLCVICHAIQGEGGRMGPDLTNLVYRDYDSVLRDIRDPNAAINPEHVAYTITKKDGTDLTAVLSAENANTVSLALPGGQVIEIPRAEIAGMKQLAISLMPPGLDQALTTDQLRDLMGYLLIPPRK